MGEYNFSIDEFKGIDKASGEDNFSPHRAACAKNFIRDKVGQIKKRGGFTVEANNTDEIHWVDCWHDRCIVYRGSAVYVTGFEDILTELTAVDTLEIGDGYKYVVDTAFGFARGEYYYVFQAGTIDSDDGTEKGETVRYTVERIAETEDGSVTHWGYEFCAQSFVQVAKAPVIRPGVGTNITDIIDSLQNAISAVINKKYKYNNVSAYIPIPIIVSNASPKGGGSLLQSPNLLSPYVQETFTVTKNDLTDGECKRFQLSMQNISLYDKEFGIIDSKTWMTTKEIDEVTCSVITENNQDVTLWEIIEGVRKLTVKGTTILDNSVKIEVYKKTSDAEDADYDWVPIYPFEAGTSNFVNTELGALWIPSANIGASPIEGEPNVRITYMRNYEEYRADLEKLFACTQAAPFGVGGYKDRVFLAGGNRIYYSGMDDPLYFGELCYIEPCSEDKEIMALGCQGQYLYAVDSDGVTHVIAGTVTEDDTNTYLSDAAFVIADRVQGEKPTIHSALNIFGEEFCYVSEEGVVAIRHDNFYDKRYAQNRSRLLGNSIKGKIIDATVWGNFLVLATDKELYLLDELQQTTLPDYKYSGKQYEVYPVTFEDNLDVCSIKKIWAEKEKLYLTFEQEDVNMVLRYDETKSKDDFWSRNGEIVAEWITPPLALSSPRFRKLIKHLHLSVGAEGDAVKVEYRVDNDTEWKTHREADGRFIPFKYSNIDYGCFNYGSFISKLQLILKRRPVKYFRKIQFRFTSVGNHSLSLADFGFTYEKEVI